MTNLDLRPNLLLYWEREVKPETGDYNRRNLSHFTARLRGREFDITPRYLKGHYFSMQKLGKITAFVGLTHSHYLEQVRIILDGIDDPDLSSISLLSVDDSLPNDEPIIVVYRPEGRLFHARMWNLGEEVEEESEEIVDVIQGISQKNSELAYGIKPGQIFYHNLNSELDSQLGSRSRRIVLRDTQYK